MILVDMLLHGLNRDKRGIFAVGKQADNSSRVRNLVFSEKLFGLKPYCGARAGAESTSICGSPELALEELQLLNGDSWIIILTEKKPKCLLVR